MADPTFSTKLHLITSHLHIAAVLQTGHRVLIRLLVRLRRGHIRQQAARELLWAGKIQDMLKCFETGYIFVTHKLLARYFYLHVFRSDAAAPRDGRVGLDAGAALLRHQLRHVRLLRALRCLRVSRRVLGPRQV